MSYWNYRVIRQYVKEYEEFVYCIHGVHYNDDGSIWAWTEDPATPFGNDLEEFKNDLELFNLAISTPVLELVVKENDVEKEEELFEVKL